jgi:hypothetical protein
MNALSKELPDTANSSEMQAKGRGTEVNLPDTVQITN